MNSCIYSGKERDRIDRKFENAFEGWIEVLNEFESVIEAGSDGLNFFCSCQVGLFLGDRLYSCTQRDHAYAICEVPVLDIIVVNPDLVEFFWSVSETSSFDLVFANINSAFTSFEDVTSFSRVRISILEKWISLKISNPGLEELSEITLKNWTILPLQYRLGDDRWQCTRI